MKWNKKKIRLYGYDYTNPGMYFITICTKDKVDYFGKIKSGKMILSQIGIIANDMWLDIPKHFLNVTLHKYIIMPDHMHGIIELLDPIELSDENLTIDLPIIGSSLNEMNSIKNKWVKKTNVPYFQKLGHLKPGSLGVIVQQYKSSVKRWCNHNGFENFQWHSRYYDRIIRDEEAYRSVSLYIENNVKNYKG